MKSILFVMSLSGTLMLILQIITSLIFNKIMSAKAKYFLLKLSVIFYLLPLSLIKNYYIDLFRYFCDIDFALSQEKIYFTDIVSNSETGNYDFSPTYMIIIIMLIIVYLVIAVLVTRQIILYCILKLKVHKYSAKVYDENIISTFNEEKEKLKLKRKVTIRSLEDIETPMTTGFIHPVILIPRGKITQKNLIWVLRHELTHIYNCDYVYRLLCIIVVAVHWFNPFAYLLLKLISISSEFNCDENIIKNLSIKQRIEYGCTILDFSTKTDKTLSNKAICMLGNYNKKIMKERIIMVKRFNKRKNFEKIIQSIIITSTILISSLTVFAYQEPEISPENMSGFSDNFSEVGAYFEYEKSEETNIKLPDLHNAEDVSYYFIDENGVVYKINNNKEKVFCEHTYSNGTYTIHKKNGNGCIMEYYNAKRCTKCGNVILGTKLNTVTYEKCPH